MSNLRASWNRFRRYYFGKKVVVPIPGIWPVKTVSLEGFKEMYPKIPRGVKLDMNNAIEEMLLKRLEHIKERVEWSKHSPGLGLYARGFSCGKLHRLIAERYFLELLMEKLAILEEE